MDRIRELWNAFNKAERKHLRNYLSALHSKGPNKSLQFIEMLEKKKELTQEEAAKKLYGNPKSKGFIMMKGRLYERMLEILSLSVSINSNDDAWGRQYNIERLKVRKQFMFGTLLRMRGLTDQAREIFEKSYQQSVELAMPELQAHSLIYLRGLYATKNDQLYQDTSQRIDEAFHHFITDTHAQGYYDQFRAIHGLRASYDEPAKWLEEKIPILREEIGENKFPRSMYYLYQLNVQYFNHIQDYSNCKKNLGELINLIETFPFFSPNQLAIAYMHMAMLELNFMQCATSIEWCEKAIPILGEGTMNHQVILLIRSYAYLHLGKLTAMEESLEILGNMERIREYPLNEGMMHFLLASLSFARGKYKNALEELDRASNLSHDKSGWITGIRLMEIMLLLELDKPDLASNKIENFRKHIAKYNVEERVRAFHRLLHGLEKNHFDFSLEIRNEGEDLEALRAGFLFRPSGYETIRYHKWFEFKRGLSGTKWEDLYIIAASEIPTHDDPTQADENKPASESL